MSSTPNSPAIAVSIVLLTHNRPKLISEFLKSLSGISYKPIEIIVVDNHSDEPVEPLLHRYPFVRTIRTSRNLGAVGRNVGMTAASGDIIITLDDDISGLDEPAIWRIAEYFRDPAVGALTFKVIDDRTRNVVDWCHHCKAEEFSDTEFLTNDIAEGAVAFRSAALTIAGVYPESFFISHEGPDLAWRLMNAGFVVKYTPQIVVRHSYSPIARTTWRRYYFDTRNLIWLALRNYPLLYGIKWTSIGLAAMLAYSLRDGFSQHWMKGVIDGLRGAPQALRDRTTPTAATRALVKSIEKNRPSLAYMLRKRLFAQRIRI